MFIYYNLIILIMDINLKNSKKYLDSCLTNKKYLVLYFVFILVSFLSMMTMENYVHPFSEFCIFILVLILGIFCFLYYCLHDGELYKAVFVIVLCFGLIFAFLSPIMIVPDEQEHLVRSDLTSRGILLPVPFKFSLNHWEDFSVIDKSNGGQFESISSIVNLSENYGQTIFHTNFLSTPINDSVEVYHSAFAQNPFFGYLPQAIGIFLAKILDLNEIWMLWLGRICNLAMYALIVAYAVKKTPILKVPFIFMACLPLAVMHGASMSIDSIVNSLALLIVAYFFFLIKSKDKSIDSKELLVFVFLIILAGLCKLSLIAFAFLLLFIPKSKFKNKDYYKYLLFGIIIVIGLLWSKFYATPALTYSYRSLFFIENNVSLSGQLNFMLNHIMDSFVMLCGLPNYLEYCISHLSFYGFPPFEFSSKFLTTIYPLFLGAIIFLYPYNNEISFKERFGVLFVIVFIFCGTYIIQLLTWTGVGNLYTIQGTQSRYFIPLLCLTPFAFGVNNHTVHNKRIDKLIIVFAIGFLASTLILTAATFY